METIAAASPSAVRTGWLEACRTALTRGRNEAQRRFLTTHDGLSAIADNAFIVDQILRALYDMATRWLFPSEDGAARDAAALSVIAVGGYGRSELAPYSDIDILFLHAPSPTARVAALIEYIAQTLWDLGSKVGHAARSVAECVARAQQDWILCTTLLDSRFICGDRMLAATLRQRFETEVRSGREQAFLAAKRAEQRQRHLKFGDSRYTLEPDIKDGAGGLRDLQTLVWSRRFLGRDRGVDDSAAPWPLTRHEERRFTTAHRFLWRVRCSLHYLTRRPENRLTFDVQTALATAFGYTTDRNSGSAVERFMKRYFLAARDVGALTRALHAALDSDRYALQDTSPPLRSLDGFPLQNGQLTAPDPKRFERTPGKLLRLFACAQRHRREIHPETLRVVSRAVRFIDDDARADPENNRLFLEILTSPETPEQTLRRMNDCGLLGRFIPDFGRVVAQMQYDMYHVYTTDEHTIRAVGLSNRIETTLPTNDLVLFHQVAQQISSDRTVLRVAVFLHDIAKGRGGDHSAKGAAVTSALCPRLGLSEEQTETVAWLVQRHLLMSETAFRRDLADAGVIHAFATEVRSVARLRLLLLLTAADIGAVGPNVWSTWKSTLLSDLYRRASHRLSDGLNAVGRDDEVCAARTALAQALALADWPTEEAQAYLALCRPSYLLAYDTATLARHAVLRRHPTATPRLDWQPDDSGAAAWVTVFATTCPDLFARLSGALAMRGMAIIAAQAHAFDDHRTLISVLIRREVGGNLDPETATRVQDALTEVLERRLDPTAAVQALRRRAALHRTSVFKVAARVLFDNTASARHTVIEVNGRDRPGLLSQLAQTLTQLRLDVVKAKIDTYGEMVVDVFYVGAEAGGKVTEDRFGAIEAALLATLNDDVSADEGGNRGDPGPESRAPPPDQGAISSVQRPRGRLSAF